MPGLQSHHSRRLQECGQEACTTFCVLPQWGQPVFRDLSGKAIEEIVHFSGTGFGNPSIDVASDCCGLMVFLDFLEKLGCLFFVA